jgi:hypothetical protein
VQISETPCDIDSRKGTRLRTTAGSVMGGSPLGMFPKVRLGHWLHRDNILPGHDVCWRRRLGFVARYSSDEEKKYENRQHVWCFLFGVLGGLEEEIVATLE